MTVSFQTTTERLVRTLRSHKAEALLVLLAAILLFSNLGDRSFGGDEPFGMELVGNILRNGAPLLREGSGLDSNLTLTINSPLSEYLMAASIGIFGFSEAAARLPMAVFGLLSIVAIYLLVLNVSGNRKLALIALVLVVFSAMFFLHARQARYYPLALFFNTVFLYAFYQYFIKRVAGKWPYVLIASLVLLFYSHPETAFYTSLAAVAWVAIKRKSVDFTKIIKITLPTILLLVPLAVLILSTKTYAITAAGLPPILQSGFLGIFAYYLSIGIYNYLLFFIPVIFFFILPKALKGYDRSVLLFFVLVVLSHIVVASAVGPFGTPSIRKLLVGTLPIAVFANAAVLYFLLADKKKVLRLGGLALLVIILFTNFIFLFPAFFFKGVLLEAPLPVPEATKETFVTKSLEPRFYFTDLLYELTHHYETPIEATLGLLKEGSRGDTVLYPRGPNVIPYTDEMGMRFSSRLEDIESHDFDWIIWEDVMGDIRETGVDLSMYETTRYSIPSWREDFWIDTADPVHHSFDSGKIPRLDVTAYRKIKN